MQMPTSVKDVKKTYFKYLGACIGSAMIASVYAFVDCIMVGQYEGPDGTAVLAVIMPIWTLIYAIGWLFGIGGAVLMSHARGNGDKHRGDVIFTVSNIAGISVALLTWLILAVWSEDFLVMFGADEKLLPLAMEYMKWINIVMPLFTVGQIWSCFIRNDGSPQKAMIAVLCGGVFNMIGDYVLVFVVDMGIEGAGLATALGQVLAVLVMSTHFFSRKNNLRLVRPVKFLYFTRRILTTGFATFVTDVAIGILAILFNNQIMRYAGSDALAVYGVIINFTAFVQSVAYGVGQSAQPLMASNYGAKNIDEVRYASRLGWISATVIGLFVLVLVQSVPLYITRLFMSTTPKVEVIAPSIIRLYGLSYLLLPVNVFATYYCQSILKPRASLTISLFRGLIFSGAMIYILPALFGSTMLWWTMTVTECATLLLVIFFVRKYDRQLLLMKTDINHNEIQNKGK